MQWNRWLGRVYFGTFISVWLVGFFGSFFAHFLDFRLSKQEGGLMIAPVLLFFALYIIVQGITYLLSKKKEKLGLGDLFKAIFFTFWCGGVIFAVVPNAIGGISFQELIISKGFIVFVIALGIGIIFASIGEMVSSRKYEKIEKEMSSEPLSYDGEKRESSSLFGQSKDDRFKR